MWSYSGVDRIASGLALQKNKDYSSDNWDEVERKIHYVSDQCFGRELLEGRLDEFPELCDWVIEVARLQLTALGQNSCLSSSDKNAIKRIYQSILDQEGL